MIAESPTLPRPRAARPHILLVEDDTCMREMMSRELDRAGYHILSAASIGEAVQLFIRDNHETALIITDYRLHDATALDLFAQLQAVGRPPEVLVTSGLLLTETLAALRRAGLTHTLSKPFRFAELLDAVAELIPAPDLPAAA